MKQVNFLVECVISEKEQTVIVRDTQSGRIVLIGKQPEDVATFLAKIIDSFKEQFSKDNHDEK